MSHVLIVDDHNENRYLLRMLLQGHGFTVEEARHGGEALKRIAQRRPDAIISDLLMPEMDGYTLLRQCKADEQLRLIPFLVYTATYTDPKDERLARDFGADEFLVKPAEPEVILACLQKLLEGPGEPTSSVPREHVEERVLLQEYNEALIRKLEKRAQQLEQANRELRQEVAERKRTEQALRESEERYRHLFDSLLDPLFVYDRETLRYLAVNNAAVDLYGYTREEFLAMSIKDIRPPEDVPALLEMLARASNRVENRGLWRHRKKNGTLLTVEISAYGMDFTGRPATVVLARDVTEQRRVEAEARRSADLLQAVADGTPDAVFIKDRNGKYLLFNRAASHFVGKPISEVLGNDDTALFPPEQARLVMEHDRRVMETNQVQTVEERLATPEGPRLFHAVKAPFRDGDGLVIGVIGVSRDITAIKQAEEALRLRDRAIQAVSQGIVISDPTLPDNPIIYASAGFERITGYSAKDVLGRNCRFLQGPDTNRETIAQLRSAISQGQSCTVELLNYRKDGTPFWNQLTISPVRGDAGQVTHFVGVLTDISERQRLEQRLRQVQKMEAVGQLAGGVAHDFNNLLTVINGYSDLLLSRLDPSDPMRELILEIHKAGERAGTLTRQLLAFSRQQVIQPRELCLNTVVLDAEKLLRRLIGEDILLVTKLNPNLGTVKADPGQLEQVLMNLAVNARDAMPRGGRLTIETQSVYLDETYCKGIDELSPGNHVLLAVSDTGCGMDRTTQARIFEPFFTTKGPGKGTGLGLATVHGIITQAKGHVAVYSEVGVGSTFKVYLPLHSEPGITPPATPVRTPLPRGTETLLLVEDEDAVRVVAVHILRVCGYRVLEASNGRDALALISAETEPIHLLISDVVMPHLGGRALAEQVAQKRPDCRILFLSGYTDDAVIRHGILDDEYAFLQKPFTPSSLAQKVRSVLDAPRAASGS